MTQSLPNEPEGHVLPFRQRGALFARHAPRPSPVADLGKYEQRADEPDDYRHRMIMNGLGLAVTIVLIAVGVWIADVMAQMRKNQDCVLAGRPGCAPIQAQIQQR